MATEESNNEVKKTEQENKPKSKNEKRKAEYEEVLKQIELAYKNGYSFFCVCEAEATMEFRACGNSLVIYAMIDGAHKSQIK